ncbi:MAG: CHAT domain-containing protein, partial [Saprospiraceae bacterium]
EEIAWVANLWDGRFLVGKEASIEEFNRYAENSRILHLSTHGKANSKFGDGDYSYLAFGVPNGEGTFSKLFAKEIYTYSLNADLVVLSACETGTGEVQVGDGISSLSRAFIFAGAKSVFATLWQVSDAKTKDLMVYFYKNLQQGKSKDEALRLAKLEFLKRNKGQGGFDHPFFWAGMIGIGDMGAVR